jgi:hypothetical protein
MRMGVLVGIAAQIRAVLTSLAKPGMVRFNPAVASAWRRRPDFCFGWSKMRNTPSEQMFSALPSISDIVRSSGHFAFGPEAA